MAEEIVRILKVDTQNSHKSINDLRKDIKSLKSELDKAVVGSQEFDDALVKLTQTQKEYNNIQKQVRDMSATNQQNMVNMARFAGNLAKSYSALNAAVGLFTDGNEDIQKSMLKVQRMIQLIQGLSGIQGLIRDIPKIANAFKGWWGALDPVEKRVNTIAKEINGISPQKLQAINEASRAAGAAGAAATATATTTRATAAAGQAAQPQVIAAQNEALSKQTNLIAANTEAAAKAESQYQRVIEKVNAHREATNRVTAAVYGQIGATEEGAEELNRLIKVQDKARESLRLELDGIDKFDNKLKVLDDSLAELIAEREKLAAARSMPVAAGLDPELEGIEKSIKLLEEQRKAVVKAEKWWFKFGATVKGVIASISSTLVVMAAIAAILKLIDAIGNYIKKVTDAAMAQQRLNKEINELANKNGAKAVVVLKELSAAYSKLGDDAKAKEKFIKEYNDKIKETGLAIDTVQEAENVFINNTPKYVAAIMARAKAQATEQKAIEIYQKYLDDRNNLENPELKWWQKALTAMATPGEGQERTAAAFLEENRKANVEKIEEMDKDIEERLKKMFENIAELEKEYMPAIAELEATVEDTTKPPKDTTDWAAEYDKALKALKKYTQERLDTLKDARTLELDQAERGYRELLNSIQQAYKDGLKAAQGDADQEKEVWETSLAAYKAAKIAYEREIADIIAKYRQQTIDDEVESMDKRLAAINQEFEILRKRTDTSNLKEPRQQNVETQYNQPAITAMLGLGSDWTNTYQSGADIKAQYEEQIKYNNDLYALTQERLTGENELLLAQQEILEKKQEYLQNTFEATDINDLETRTALAEQLKQVEVDMWTNKQTLAENEIALNDALNDNYEANTQAFISMQEKKQQAMNATLSVSSNLMGAMAQMAKTEAQNENKGITERQNAMKAYKAFAVTQAIINTYQGANEAYTSMASIPYVGPALGIAAAVAAIAMGIANVHSILSEKMPSESDSPTVSAPAALQTAPIEYTRQLVGDSELNEMNQPIKCYVLESDITSTQNKVAVTESNASF